MTESSSAWVILLGAGAANATFSLPMKHVRRWEWENTWTVWTIAALLVLPLVAAFLGLPSLASVYSRNGWQTAAVIWSFGVGWGLAQVLFGRAIQSIGIGLAFSIVLGISAACGTLLPMLRIGGITSHANMALTAGLIFVAMGVAACAVAGRLREAAQAPAVQQRGFTAGLAMAIASGVLASFMNLGVAFGGPLLERVAAEGIGPARGMFAVWLPLLVGGAMPNLAYCRWLLRRNNTWSLYRGSGQAWNVFMAVIMAVLWFGSTILYGFAAHRMGGWGVVLGWPIFMSVIVITAGLIGVVSGEWVHSGTRPILFQTAGICLLVFAIAAFSLAQRSLQSSTKQSPLDRRSISSSHVR